MNIPKDRFLPPSVSFGNMDQVATGAVDKAIESPYANHWWDGNSDFEYYLDYHFEPLTAVTQPDGKVQLVKQGNTQAGRIKISRDQYEKTVAGTPVTVSYDPYNPLLNGVHGTGEINVSASIISGWLLYVLGFIATTVLVGEICKKWIVPDAI
jgi:hypothetical protein